MKKNLILILVAVLIVNVASGLKDDPTTTTTTTTTTPSTTTTTETTTTVVTTTTTTTPVTTTTITTVAPITTTPSTDIVLNFTIPKNSSLPTCLRLKFSLSFEIKYIAEVNDTKTNATTLVTLNKYDDYDGICSDSINQFTLTFNDVWKVQFTYKLKNKNEYSLDTIVLNYTADSVNFPNINNDDKDKQFTSNGTNLDEFSASKGNSFKCSAKTTVVLDGKVTVDFKNYQGQPFISSESKSTDFDTAIECPADTAGTSKLVPIIVGSSLALLVILVLIAYIIGRQKHRTGYQQV